MIWTALIAAGLAAAPNDQPNAEPIECPPGAKLRGAAPPRGKAQWCEAPDLFGGMKKNGPFRRWYADGSLRSTGEFLDGERHGRWQKWDEEGNLLGERTYRFGEVHSEQRSVAHAASSAAPTRATPDSEASRSSNPFSENTATTEAGRSKVGGFASTDFTVFGTDGVAVFGQEFQAGLRVNHFELQSQWGFIYADASGTSSVEGLNPTFYLLGRADLSDSVEFRSGVGASIPVRDVDTTSFDSIVSSAVSVGLVGLSAIPRGYWDAWMYLPEYPFIILPFTVDARVSRFEVDGSSTFYFAIPINGGSSQLNMQLSASGAYAFTDFLLAGLETRAVVASLTAAPEGTLGIEPFAKAVFGPGFARVGFTLYPLYSDLLGAAPLIDGLIWGFNVGVGVQM